MRCKLLVILFFMLLTISLVKSYNLKDEPQATRRVSKHHRRVKSALKESEVAAKPTDSDDLKIIFNAKTAHEPPTDIKEKEDEKVLDNEKIGRSGDHATENHELLAEDDIPQTVFVGSLSRRSNLDGTNDNQDDDIDYPKEENHHDSDNLGNENESGEVLLYSPNSKTLSEDIVLDLTARTGNDPSIENNLRNELVSSEIESRMGPFSDFDINMRSGYVPPDNTMDIPNTFDYQAFDANPFNWPNAAYGNDPMAQFHRPNEAKQGSLQAQLPNQLSLFSPLYKELMYPHSNSPISSWEVSSPGQFENTMTPHFGQNYPKSQGYNPKTLQKCSACHARAASSSDHYNSRSIEARPNTFETANGRVIEFEPIGSNSYPFVPYEVSEDAQGILNARSQKAFKGQESNLVQNFQSSNERRQGNPDTNPLANVVKPYFRGIPIMLNRRVVPKSVKLERFLG